MCTRVPCANFLSAMPAGLRPCMKGTPLAIVKDWFVSSHTAANNTCVQARIHADRTVDIRNSKNPEAGMVSFTGEEWDVFLKGARDGEFDLA